MRGSAKPGLCCDSAAFDPAVGLTQPPLPTLTCSQSAPAWRRPGTAPQLQAERCPKLSLAVELMLALLFTCSQSAPRWCRSRPQSPASCRQTCGHARVCVRGGCLAGACGAHGGHAGFAKCSKYQGTKPQRAYVAMHARHAGRREHACGPAWRAAACSCVLAAAARRRRSAARAS